MNACSEVQYKKKANCLFQIASLFTDRHIKVASPGTQVITFQQKISESI